MCRCVVMVGWLAGCAHEAAGTATVCIGDPDTRRAEIVAENDRVTLNATASGSCHHSDFEVSCDVTRVGNDLVVTTETTWREPLSFQCELALTWAHDTCETPALPAGTYTLRYGSDAVPLTVPGPVLVCVDGDPGSPPPLVPDTGT